jgi:hypothetical protein
MEKLLLYPARLRCDVPNDELWATSLYHYQHSFVTYGMYRPAHLPIGQPETGLTCWYWPEDVSNRLHKQAIEQRKAKPGPSGK